MIALAYLAGLLATFALGSRVGGHASRAVLREERGRWQAFTDELAADNLRLRDLLTARAGLALQPPTETAPTTAGLVGIGPAGREWLGGEEVCFEHATRSLGIEVDVEIGPPAAQALSGELGDETTQVSASERARPSTRRPEAGAAVLNDLARLRATLEVGQHEVAARMRVALGQVGAIETALLDELTISSVRAFVGALGCRLDVVAVHIDGSTTWLSDAGAL